MREEMLVEEEELMEEEEPMMSIRFSVPGKPFGKQRPRVVHNGSFSKAYTPKETVNYENLVRLMYSNAARGRMFRPGEMLDVRIIAYYEIPKSVSKKKRKAMLEHRIRPTSKPDVDNIEKIICDSLNLVAYHDDSAIVDAQVRKFYAEMPRVDVILKDWMIWLIVMVGLMGFMAIWFLMIVLFGMEGNGGLELLRKVPEVVK